MFQHGARWYDPSAQVFISEAPDSGTTHYLGGVTEDHKSVDRWDSVSVAESGKKSAAGHYSAKRHAFNELDPHSDQIAYNIHLYAYAGITPVGPWEVSSDYNTGESGGTTGGGVGTNAVGLGEGGGGGSGVTEEILRTNPFAFGVLPVHLILLSSGIVTLDGESRIVDTYSNGMQIIRDLDGIPTGEHIQGFQFRAKTGEQAQIWLFSKTGDPSQLEDLVRIGSPSTLALALDAIGTLVGVKFVQFVFPWLGPAISSVADDVLLRIQSLGDNVITGAKGAKSFVDDALKRFAKPIATAVDDSIKSTQKALQHTFSKHAGDFGLTGTWNPQRAAELLKAIQAHIRSGQTQAIFGSYRGDAVWHYVDPRTGLNVITDLQGNLIGGWRLSAEQLQSLLLTGRVF